MSPRSLGEGWSRLPTTGVFGKRGLSEDAGDPKNPHKMDEIAV